jgi:hypothetical protein
VDTTAVDRGLHPKKAAFLKAYALTGIIARAAEVAEVTRMAYYKWCEHDQDFKLAAEQARQEAADHLEHYLFQRAAGAGKKVRRTYAVVKGKRVLTEEVEEEGPSDTAAIFLLKGIRPEKYRERAEVSVTGPVVKAYAGFDPSEV